MFVRRKQNKSGIVSIQVIDKSGGRYKVVKTIGSSSDKPLIEKLVEDGELWIQNQKGLEFDFEKIDDLFEHFIDGIQQINIIGPQLLLGKIFNEIGFSSENRLVISYSDSRARKDEANRQRGITKLEKLIRTKRLTKAQINNKGYNKFLKMTGEIEVILDKTKIAQDKKWDGLKGYLTNTTLGKDQIIENYSHLWRIEKAFRVAKSDIKIRPIFHQLPRRIEAHICIAFVGYKIYKELERQLEELKAELSPEKAIDIAKTIYCIKAQKPKSKEIINRILLLNEEQRFLAKLFNF